MLSFPLAILACLTLGPVWTYTVWWAMTPLDDAIRDVDGSDHQMMRRGMRR